MRRRIEREEMHLHEAQFAPGLVSDLLEQVILREERPILLYIQGKSMEPNLQEGDLVEVVAFGFNQVKSGDILLFKHGDELLLHRALYISRLGVWLKGDGLLVSEGWIHKELIIGKAIKVCRGEMEYSLTDCRAVSRARAWAMISDLVERLYKPIAITKWGFGGRGSELFRRIFLAVARPFRLPLTLSSGLYYNL